MTRTVYIGIDPGIHTGFALWDAKLGKLELQTLDFWQTVDAIHNANALYNDGVHVKLVVVIEAAWKINTTYGRYNGQSGERGIQRIARNAGENHAHGKLIVEFCKRNGVEALLITPNKRKMDAAQFALLTKHPGRTNEHVRDAAMLVWGRT